MSYCTDWGCSEIDIVSCCGCPGYREWKAKNESRNEDEELTVPKLCSEVVEIVKRTKIPREDYLEIVGLLADINQLYKIKQLDETSNALKDTIQDLLDKPLRKL